MSSTLVETRSLAKRYGPVTALEDCTLDVGRGEVFGLLGPNGAGKTTLLRLLLGLLRPTAGRATIEGLDCRHRSLDVRRRVAYLPGDVRLFPGMRGRDVLRFCAHTRGADPAKFGLDLAARFDLDLTRSTSAMSTGMRQKLALVTALAADTPLVILDEPTSNLDPTVRGEVSLLVREARAAGRSVLFSSHVLDEVERVCDRVGFLRGGRLVHIQVMSELRRRHRIRARLTGAFVEPPTELRSVLNIDTQGDRLTIEADGELAPVLRWLALLPLDEVRIEPLGLAAVYERLHEARA